LLLVQLRIADLRHDAGQGSPSACSGAPRAQTSPAEPLPPWHISHVRDWGCGGDPCSCTRPCCHWASSRGKLLPGMVRNALYGECDAVLWQGFCVQGRSGCCLWWLKCLLPVVAALASAEDAPRPSGVQPASSRRASGAWGAGEGL